MRSWIMRGEAVRSSSRVAPLIVCLALGLVGLIAGCCRSSGPTHKCDFTPPDEPGVDGGSDGPMPCGTAICELGQVCCYKKSPPLALCIDPSQYMALGCEMLDLPCFSPKDCPGGGALSCCVNFTAAGGEVTCRPPALCLADGAYIACETEAACPLDQPCTFLAIAMDKPFSICGQLGAQSLQSGPCGGLGLV